MNALPRRAQAYILFIFGGGLAAALVSGFVLLADPPLVITTIALIVANALLDLYPVSVQTNQKNNSAEVTVSVAVKIASIFLVPLPVVILSSFGGTLLSELWLKRVWYKLIFNVGAITVNSAITASIYLLIREPGVPLLGTTQNLLALAALGLGDVVVNGFLISMVIGLATSTRVDYIWRQSYRPLLVHDLSMIPMGVVLYILWEYSPWSIVLAALPLVVMRHSYQLVADLGRQTREALYALARVLDERDEHTSQHSDFVSEHAGLIARELGLSPDEVDVIMRAAALHDIGKVGMRNDILFKPGTLTPAEREMAQRHASLGGQLLEKFPLFEKGAVYVRHHHERWDGSGYPDGLEGESIPLGARILAVSDSFQAMIEERPYRRPLTQTEALEELRRGAGTQFDPTVVQAFLRTKKVPVPVAEEPVLEEALPAALREPVT
jgi:putative nucleotidyltransferase with HDIG domain